MKTQTNIPNITKQVFIINGFLCVATSEEEAKENFTKNLEAYDEAMTHYIENNAEETAQISELLTRKGVL